MFRNIQYVLIAATAVVLTLAYLARRFPRVDWLQRFRIQRPYDPARDRELDTAWMPEEERWREELKHRKASRKASNPFRAFLADLPQLPEEQKQKFRRRSNIIGGLELIVLGVALPFAYYMFSMMMFFHTVSRTENIVLFTASAACVVLGITALFHSGRA